MRLFLLAGLLAAIALAAPPAASAQPIDLTCASSSTATARPGFTTTPQMQTVSTALRLGSAVSPLTPCLSLTGSRLRGATGSLTGGGVLSCAGGPATGTGELRWNTGETSVFSFSSYNLAVVPFSNITITRGPLQGTTIVSQTVPTGASGTCLLGPLRSATFVGTFTALGPSTTPPTPG